MSTSNMYLSLIGSTWIRSRVHVNYFGSDPVCTPEKFWIRSKKERSRTDPLSCAQDLNATLKFEQQQLLTVFISSIGPYFTIVTITNCPTNYIHRIDSPFSQTEKFEAIGASIHCGVSRPLAGTRCWRTTGTSCKKKRVISYVAVALIFGRWLPIDYQRGRAYEMKRHY